MQLHPNRVVMAVPMLVLLTLGSFCACGRPPSDKSSDSDAQKLPFDRQPRSTGISPSHSLIPSTTKLPEGTPIPVRLRSALSSASSHAGDTFSAAIDAPVVIDGQTLVPQGSQATGRVLEAKPAASSRGSSVVSSFEPGYLRIVLVSLNVGGKTLTIETSSIFAKGGSRDERNSATGMAAGAGQNDKNKDNDKNRDKDRDKDIAFGVDRRLSFRLAQAADLQ